MGATCATCNPCSGVTETHEFGTYKYRNYKLSEEEYRFFARHMRMIVRLQAIARGVRTRRELVKTMPIGYRAMYNR